MKSLKHNDQVNDKIFFEKILVLFFVGLFFLSLLSLSRVFLTGWYSELYLSWNLLLAFIPLVFLYITFYTVKHRFFKFFFIFLSFLFLPNAPYVITDSFHISVGSPIIWFDTLLFFSFAFLALVYYFFYIFIFLKVYKKFFDIKKEMFFVFLVSFLSSFGIFLGRELRFNSWDILNNPLSLILKSLDIFLHPFSYNHFLNIMVFWTLFLFGFFYFIKSLVMLIKKYYV